VSGVLLESARIAGKAAGVECARDRCLSMSKEKTIDWKSRVQIPKGRA
jgi:hypothetical protein